MEQTDIDKKIVEWEELLDNEDAQEFPGEYAKEFRLALAGAIAQLKECRKEPNRLQASAALEMARMIERRTKEACKKAKPDSSPWPEDIWTMTDEEYVKAIPDKYIRTAISGFLMRKGWELAIEDFERAIKEAEVT